MPPEGESLLELSPIDRLIMLLRVAAEVEHALMVQYLFAAYSLGGPGVPVEDRDMVRNWQEGLLAIAREEMGHLLTVLNLKVFLGTAPILSRQSFPWDNPYCPVPFSLEPFTLNSLACYAFAEMPDPDEVKNLEMHSEKLTKEVVDELTAKVVACVQQFPNFDKAKNVGFLYDRILSLIKDETLIPDDTFHEDSYRYQASWDDWGRRRREKPVLVDAAGNLADSAPPQAGAAPPSTVSQREGMDPDAHRCRVLVYRMATRRDAVDALTKIATQGEAPNLETDSRFREPSHFERFLLMYDEFRKKPEGWSPSRPVVSNPTTQPLNSTGKVIGGGSKITAEPANSWASLFNLRYRMLMTYLLHTFRLGAAEHSDEPTRRAPVMHRAFGEMYNLKTIAGILVQLPAVDGEPGFAGPPFQMPYTLSLPLGEPQCWVTHRRLVASSRKLCDDLLAMKPAGDALCYLQALQQLDRETEKWILAMEGGN